MTPAAPPLADDIGGKKSRRMLVYGNCQAGWLAQSLQRNAEIAARYEIIYLSDYAVIPADHPIHQLGFLSTCTDAVWQTASGCKRPEFLSGLRADCRQIRFPTLWLKLLWPTYAVDPRNVPEKDFPWGRYPYGDRLVMKLLQEGVSLDDLPKRYVETDLNRIVNVDRFTEMSSPSCASTTSSRTSRSRHSSRARFAGRSFSEPSTTRRA
jgi:hypothetical protein